MDFCSMLVYNYIIYCLFVFIACSFGLCRMQVHPPRHFAQRERQPEYTPTKTFEKKSGKPFIIKHKYVSLYKLKL